MMMTVVVVAVVGETIFERRNCFVIDVVVADRDVIDVVVVAAAAADDDRGVIGC